VSLGAIVESIGNRSFGPLLLLAGILTISPLSGIPGMPTAMGVLVLLIAGQLLLGKKQFWLPGWLVRRSVAQSKLEKALTWLRPPARFIDRVLRERLMALVQGASLYVIAGICAAIALTMPAMEVVPFSVNIAGAAIATFGLALIARDGVLAVLGYLFTAAVVGLLVYKLVS
jgi:hypothetical protein